MAKLTRKEKAWLNKVQKILDECPSGRIAFYTIGDRNMCAYDVTMYDQVTEKLDSGALDFGPAVAEVGASFEEDIIFINPVESAAG